MKKISVWLSAMRLRTLPLSVSGIIVASGLAYYKGIFNPSIFALALLTTVSLQILSNLANDYGDGVKGTDNDDRIGPERALQSGAISPKEMLNAIKINSLISMILAVSLITVSFGLKHIMLAVIFLALAIAALAAAIKYTVGDSAYGYKGLGDVFVFLFFGLVSVLGCYILYAKTLHSIMLLPAITFGALSAAVLNLNNMRDIDSDKTANKITLAVRLGRQNAKLYHYALIGIAIASSLWFGTVYYKTPIQLLFTIVYIPLILHALKVYKNTKPKQLDPELKKVALSTFFLSVLLALSFVF
jgi:1,4-dihydroxy-2-naphthoate octaprenyltransferase